MERHFEENLKLARGVQQSLDLKMAVYIDGPNLDNTGMVIGQQVKPSFGGGTEPTSVNNEGAPSIGRDDHDQAAARSAMRGVEISQTVNLYLPGGDSHITGKVGGDIKRTEVNDWKDPSRDPTPQKGTAITKLTWLAVPIVRPIRAETADGVTSFHFSYEPISKTRVERKSDTRRKTRRGSAKDHADYIERFSAVARADRASAEEGETLEKIEADFEKPASKKIEELSPNGEEQILADVAAKLGEAAVGGVYVERQEAMALEADGSAVLYTNIDADPFERRKFWELVEKNARNPGKDYMRIRVIANPRLWSDVFSAPDCPKFEVESKEPLDPKGEIRIQNEDNDRMRAHMLRHGWNPPKRREVDGLNHEEEATAELQQDKADGIVFEDARGGRIQYRIIGELPHEVDQDARVRILRAFAQEFERRGLPYVAVMHAPDHTNNDKNWHFHLIYHDRPAARFVNDRLHPANAHLAPNVKDPTQTATMKAEARNILGTADFEKFAGQWDFSIPYTRKSVSGNTRTRNPFAQPKHRECQKKDFIPKLRKVLADITNEELASAGHRRRLDPRDYSKIGIPRQPDKHLGTQAAQHETSGISTDVGRENERNQWTYQMTMIQRFRQAEEEKLRCDIAKMRRANQAIVGEDPRADIRERLIARYEQIRRAAIEHEVIARTMQENIDRAASRAHKVKLTCEKHLKAIRDKKASKRQMCHKSDYENKLNEAVTHLAGLKTMFANEAMQVSRSAEQAKLLQIEAEESRADYDILIQQAHAEQGIANSQVPSDDKPATSAPSSTLDQTATISTVGVTALTKAQMDDFVDTVFKQKIRLVMRNGKIDLAYEDPRMDVIINAPNFASLEVRLKVIYEVQTEAINDLLEVLNNNPQAVESRTGPNGQAVVTLKMNDKRLQEALQHYHDDKDISLAIANAFASQRPSERVPEAVSKATSVAASPATATSVLPTAKPAPQSTREPAVPYQDIVRRALFERTLSGTRWEETDNKRFLILTNSSAERLQVPSRIEIAPELAETMDKTISAADREEFRLRKYIEAKHRSVVITPLNIIIPDYAPEELREIAAKHSNDPERRKLYAAMPQLADEWYKSTRQYQVDFAVSPEGKEVARLADERTEIERSPQKFSKREDDNKPDPRYAALVPAKTEEKGRPFVLGIHPKLDTYLLAEARNDDVARRLAAEEIIKDVDAARATKRLTLEDRKRIKDDSIYNDITRGNNPHPQNSLGLDIGRQIDRGLSPQSD